MMKWTDLKRESHIRLACGCEGFVKSIHFDNDPLISGFLLMYTTNGCQKRESCEQAYKSGHGPSQCFFNSAMAESSMPAELCPLPSWWKDIQADKTNPELKLP